MTIYIGYFKHGPTPCKRGGFDPGAIPLGAHGGRPEASTRDDKVDPACASPPLGGRHGVPRLAQPSLPAVVPKTALVLP